MLKRRDGIDEFITSWFAFYPNRELPGRNGCMGGVSYLPGNAHERRRADGNFLLEAPRSGAIHTVVDGSAHVYAGCSGSVCARHLSEPFGKIGTGQQLSVC